ncbi:MAG: type 4 pilus major pilin [Acidobacteriaceae bacterium]
MPIMMIFAVVVIALIIVAGIFGGQQLLGGGNQSTAQTQIGTIAAKIQALYANQATFTGLTTAGAISAGMLPKNMVASTTSAVNPFGGAVDILDGGAAGATPAPSFVVQYDGISATDCQALATSITAASAYIGSDVGTSGSFVGGSPIAVNNTAVTPTQAATACVNPKNSVAFVFTKSSD